MRPVDLLPNAPHPNYDKTFDNLTGSPLLKIIDITWENADQASSASTIADSIYTFFRNNELWSGQETPGLKPTDPWNGTTRLSPPPPSPINVIPAQDLLVLNRDGRKNAAINAQILRIQHDTKAQKRFFQLWVVVPADEIADLIRIWQEGAWNSNIPPAITAMPLAIRDELRKKGEGGATKDGLLYELAFGTETVPEKPSAPGSYAGYRGAIRDLQEVLGGYCSYCEAKRQDGKTHDVEHRLAKAYYASEVLRWDNFLLGCEVCNQRKKKDMPDRAFGILNAIKARGASATIPYTGGNVSPVIPYHEMRKACDEFMIWPSLDDGGTADSPIQVANPNNPTNYSLLCFKYVLQAYDNATGNPQGGPIDLARAIDLGNEDLGDGAYSTVKAKVRNLQPQTGKPADYDDIYVRLECIARDPGIGNTNFNDRKYNAANKTIDTVGLNTLPNAFGDRRMVERTRMWFRAIKNLKLLGKQLARLRDWNNRLSFLQLFGPPSVDFTNDQWDLVADSAEGGYYSVWLTVFKAHNLPLAQKLAKTLQDRAVKPNSPPSTYKGSNFVNSVSTLLPRL